jgi:hypothetical protein
VPSVPDGCFLPVQLSVAGAVSNVATISVSKTGNCTSATTGLVNVGTGGGASGGIFLERVAAQAFGLTLQTSEVSASFNRSVAGSVESTGGFAPAGSGCLIEVSKTGAGSSLVGFPSYTQQVQLDAGTSLLLTSPSNATYPVPLTSPGNYGIPLSLSGGSPTITTGKWTIAGPGGKDVGAFTASLTIPQLFTVTSTGVAAGTFSQSQPLTPTWTCSDPTGQVIVAVSSGNTTTGITGGATCSAVCSAGSYTVPASVLKQLPVSTSGGAQITVFYLPSIAKVATFTAPGLNTGFFVYADATAAANLTMNP